jgi:hypothetical protein
MRNNEARRWGDPPEVIDLDSEPKETGALGGGTSLTATSTCSRCRFTHDRSQTHSAILSPELVELRSEGWLRLALPPIRFFSARSGSVEAKTPRFPTAL